MKATAFEFRFRLAIHVVVVVLGFWAPWDYWLQLDGTGPNAHVWGLLSVMLSKSGAVGIASAFNLVLSVGIGFAALGAWLRTWGEAYLSVDVMKDSRMRGAAVVADGPYRYLRNPLYLGTFLHAIALALLMPPSGAIFTVVLVGVFQVRLILAEEAFLAAKLGEPYLAYCAAVPRLLPTLRPRVAVGGLRPQWLQAFLGEMYMWGVAGSFAVLGWRYNALLLTRCVLISWGLSIVARALLMKERPATVSA